MRVLAIDPGFDRMGVAILDGNVGSPQLVYSTCLTTTRGEPVSARITSLGKQLSAIIQTHAPTALAIETLFFNRNVKTAIDVAQARGMVLYVASLHGCDIHEYSPQAIKIATTGFGQSDKVAVYQMVKRLVPATPETALDDEHDAIAIGITCLAHNRGGR
jgi:crossover junction endodeoxyribonuclease RuvC